MRIGKLRIQWQPLTDWGFKRFRAWSFFLRLGHLMIAWRKLKPGHWSDCALHNMPAKKGGICDCGLAA